MGNLFGRLDGNINDQVQGHADHNPAGAVGPLNPDPNAPLQLPDQPPYAGIEQSPQDIDTVADIVRTPQLAKVRGIADMDDQIGVYGYSPNNTGVWGKSEKDIGVYGQSPKAAGVFEGPVLVSGPLQVKGSGLFSGDIEVKGDIRLVNADFAEDFTIAEIRPVDPGTVMVLGEPGKLHCSQKAYDRRVVGVISGAGPYKPGLILDRTPAADRQPVALVGKVYCKVDARYGAVEAGDLLTTSPTPGHAMKAADPLQAFGACLGKALAPLPEGQALIPILVTLQ